MAFDPDKFVAQPKAFDPDAFVGAPSKPRVGAPEAQATLEHFGNEVTSGHLPQIQAAVSQLLPDPTAGTKRKLAEQGITVQEAPSGYAASRDANMRRLAEQERESPIASSIGKLGGLAGSLVLTGGLGKLLGIGKAITTGGRIAQGAGTGAVAGALRNPGEAGGDDIVSNLKARGQNAVIGGVTGAGVQGGLGLVSGLGSKLAENLGSEKAIAATKSLGSRAGRMAMTGVGTGLGAAIGGPVGAVAGGMAGDAARNIGRKAGASLADVGRSSLASIAGSTPALTAFARNNPMKFQVMMSQLMAPSVQMPKDGEQFALLEDQDVMNAFRSSPELLAQVQDARLKQAIQDKLAQ